MIRPPRPCGRSFALAMAICLASLLAGCATWQRPAEGGEAPIRSRAVSVARDQVTLSAAVLSTEDSLGLLGANVNATGVQPVWIEIRNDSSQSLALLRTGTDPDYFSPLEIAWSLHGWLGSSTNAQIDEWFNHLGFGNPIPPGETRSGIVFTNPARGTKILNVDLLGNERLVVFTLFLRVPDDAGDPSFSRPLFAYPPSVPIKDFQDLPSLRTALESLPSCATDATGQFSGDPLNGVAIGGLEDFGAAMVRRNYRRNQLPSDDEQYVFGRIPDAVLRKQRRQGASPNWIRAWLVPFRYQGRSVYIVQIGRPVGGRFATDSTQPALHDDVDEARNMIVQDAIYSEGLEKLGFSTGVGAASRQQERSSLDGAHYFTDGLRAVLFFAVRPLSLSDLEILDWAKVGIRADVGDIREDRHAGQDNGSAR